MLAAYYRRRDPDNKGYWTVYAWETSLREISGPHAINGGMLAFKMANGFSESQNVLMSLNLDAKLFRWKGNGVEVGVCERIDFTSELELARYLLVVEEGNTNLAVLQNSKRPVSPINIVSVSIEGRKVVVIFKGRIPLASGDIVQLGEWIGGTRWLRRNVNVEAIVTRVGDASDEQAGSDVVIEQNRVEFRTMDVLLEQASSRRSASRKIVGPVNDRAKRLKEANRESMVERVKTVGNRKISLEDNE